MFGLAACARVSARAGAQLKTANAAEYRHDGTANLPAQSTFRSSAAKFKLVLVWAMEQSRRWCRIRRVHVICVVAIWLGDAVEIIFLFFPLTRCRPKYCGAVAAMETIVNIPHLYAVPPFDGWTILAMEKPASVPRSRSVSVFHCRTSNAMQEPVLKPAFGAPGVLDGRAILTMQLSVEQP